MGASSNNHKPAQNSVFQPRDEQTLHGREPEQSLSIRDISICLIGRIRNILSNPVTLKYSQLRLRGAGVMDRVLDCYAAVPDLIPATSKWFIMSLSSRL